MNETLVHQQLSLHQLHHRHPSQRLPKRFFRLRDVTRSIYTSIERATTLWTNTAHVMREYKVRALLFRIDKLMSGSSVEGKAFLRSHKTLKAFYLGKFAAQNPDL